MKTTFIHPFRLSLKWLLLIIVTALTLLSSCVLLKPDKVKPTLYLIGDSTVKSGRGKGEGGLWGWGSFIGSYFDSTRLNVENHALGGTSSRTFQTQGHWAKVLDRLQPGDYVLLQFGHNDDWPLNDTLRARGTIKGTGEESQEIDNLITKKHEVVHTYGWYIRKFIRDSKAKGATAMVLSPVPRNIWHQGQANRNNQDYGKWAAEAARQEGALFIDLNKIIADRYEAEGEAKVRATYYNTTDHTHTILAGARVNAAAVVTGIKKTKNCPLQKYLTKAAHRGQRD